ncbi:MAG: cobalamin-dependent protein [Candidatus Aadella gelida]|nr:cobalamin-dependent protein [Candidatus Aadella gelida]
MNIKIIYPKWQKLLYETEFNLPPHSPLCFAAALDKTINVSFCDENVEQIDFSEDADLVAISAMLTCQMPRGWEIADRYRQEGKTVIFGGIATTLHGKETLEHADAIFLGEAEGRFHKVIDDFKQGRLKKVYDHRLDFPDTDCIGEARRDLLKKELYKFRGIQMLDLVHTARGCKFDCFTCCTPYLGGGKFRPRPLDKVISEMENIDNNRMFITDNSMAQDEEWQKKLFKAMVPLKKKWVSHPISDSHEITELAAKAGCWFIYQGIVDTSDYIRNRIRRYKENGIGVKGAVIIGLDNHDEDYIKRLVDFLLEVELDVAEFTILTPFLHTPIRAQLEKEGRILHNDWSKYTAGNVVFKPAKMTVESLEKMNEYAWKTFYKDCSKELKMAKLYMQVFDREKKDGTYKNVTLSPDRNWKNSENRKLVSEQ